MSSNLFFAFLFAFGVFLMFAAFRVPRTLGRRVVDRTAEEGPRMATFAEASLLQAMLADLSRKIAPERPTLWEQLRQSGWVIDYSGGDERPPKRVRLTRGDLDIRLAIDEWQLPP